jgi:hypothetical protein
MQLQIKKSGKADKYDSLRCLRSDGSSTSMAMPRQGILPHDLIHFVVESALGFTDAFLGMVAKGADMQFVMQQVHELGSPMNRDQAAQAEAAVESLQAQLWSGVFDAEAFFAGMEAACAMRNAAAPNLGGINLERDLYKAALALSAHWQQVPFHGEMELKFPVA